ncbi:MAG: 3-dehydroquinate synthase [Gammaproteobacteria bacterium]|jgi:3-dehydroquinate synthase|nr:3-dehydroquinate synthase [Gammaproteobacteria bacterium]
MKTIYAALGNKTYPIHIGQGLLQRSDLFADLLSSRRILLVTHERISALYTQKIQSHPNRQNLLTCILPEGEEHKTLKTAEIIFDKLLEHHYHRDTVLIAMGGGVIGDISGFAAACYQRGIDYLQVPTTLLAQVDAAIGGKTAVNHRLGKNMIGMFHQPQGVIIDIDTLKTLEPRQFRSGLAEVIKYGLISDAAFFEWFEKHLDAILNHEPDVLIHMISRSCESKLHWVSQDEYDKKGYRALLNFGHTFGHAIECALDYGHWLHGEAVAAGMVMAAHLSADLGWLSRSAVKRIEALLARIGLPVRLPKLILPETLFAAMQHDKKCVQEGLTLVLLKEIGHAFLYREVTKEAVLQVITQAGDTPFHPF